MEKVIRRNPKWETWFCAKIQYWLEVIEPSKFPLGIDFTISCFTSMEAINWQKHHSTLCYFTFMQCNCFILSYFYRVRKKNCRTSNSIHNFIVVVAFTHSNAFMLPKQHFISINYYMNIHRKVSIIFFIRRYNTRFINENRMNEIFHNLYFFRTCTVKLNCTKIFLVERNFGWFAFAFSFLLLLLIIQFSLSLIITIWFSD